METSRFFNYVEGDLAPEYEAGLFAEYFSRFLTNGVYASGGQMGLKVTISDLTATVATGYAFLRGYLYKNDSPINITLEPANTVAGLNRLDRIVIKLDVVAGEITAQLKTGTASSTPTAPTLINTNDVLEIPLAQIRVNSNASTGTVTDQRVPVSSLIDIPLADMQAEFSQFLSTREGLAASQITALEAQFDTWMGDIQTILDESTAGNLLALIEANAYDIGVLQTDKMEDSRIKLSTTDAVLAQMNDGDIWIKYE